MDGNLHFAKGFDLNDSVSTTAEPVSDKNEKIDESENGKLHISSFFSDDKLDHGS